MWKKLIIIALVFQAGTSLAQEYIITAKNDTVRGVNIRILSYDIIDRIEVSIDKKKNQYTAVQVSADELQYSLIRYSPRHPTHQHPRIAIE